MKNNMSQMINSFTYFTSFVRMLKAILILTKIKSSFSTGIDCELFYRSILCNRSHLVFYHPEQVRSVLFLMKFP